MDADKNRRTDLSRSFTFRSGVTVRNRLALAPMTNLQSHEDGSLSDEELEWLRRRAAGGFGLVETCASHVALDGQGWPGELGIFDDRLLPGLTRLAGALKAAGSVSLVQIFHGGARAPQKVTGQQAWSASELPGDPEAPRPATEADITRTIAAFRDAAVRASRAGFDGVELHGAHGYLLCQFLSRLNVRTDGWGGDLVGRARLLRETLRQVRAAVPKGFVVGVRISPEDFGNAKGLDLDENLTLAGWLAEDGIDFLHLSLWQSGRNTTKRPDEHAVTLFRKVLPADVAIIAAGAVWTPEEAVQLMGRGADLVAIGRAAILNPDWPRQAIADAAWSPRRPPMSPAELAERSVSPRFIEYLRNWKNFVASSDTPSAPSA